MDALDTQKALVQLLIKRLKECAIKDAARSMVFSTFTPSARKHALSLLESYRQDEEVIQKVERQFRGLDSLIQQIDAAIHPEEVHKLLQSLDLKSRPN